MENVQIPRFIDDQPSILFWDLDEFIIFAFFIMMGIWLKSMMLGMIFGYFVVQKFKKGKGNHLEGRLAHMAYYYGILDLNPRFNKKETTYFK